MLEISGIKSLKTKLDTLEQESATQKQIINSFNVLIADLSSQIATLNVKIAEHSLQINENAIAVDQIINS